VRSEEEAEFRRFVAARSAALLRTAYLLTGDRAGAEDLLQTALAKTYRYWPRLESRAAFESYVRTTMTRTAVSWWRRRRREAELLVGEAAPASASSHDTADDHDEMWRQLLLLPTKQRAVLVLRYYEDLSEAEIGRVLNCSPGTVKSQAHRGLHKLRQLFDSDSTDVISGERR
jgi:RNA polymerase sigma-70 factor (ECF subfamily)